MLCCLLPAGIVTTIHGEMRRHAVGYREEDYSGCYELLRGLPRLIHRGRATLDANISMEELTTAVGQMAYGQAPGLDGLSTDFYKHFLRGLGADLWEVLQECTQMGLLPTSCRNTVLSLIPKKGDLALLNKWTA